MCYYIYNKEGDKDGINYFLFNNILFRLILITYSYDVNEMVLLFNKK